MKFASAQSLTSCFVCADLSAGRTHTRPRAHTRAHVQRVTLAKNVVLEELTWSSLRRPVRDLVMLDVMNQPLILHNLKDRFAQNEIYVRLRLRLRHACACSCPCL